MNNVSESFVRALIETQKLSHNEVIEKLVETYGDQRGFSGRSLRRYCQEKGIHRYSAISDAELDEVVASAVGSVGPVYGRRTIKGYIDSHELPTAGENRVGQALRRVTPIYHEMRETATSRQLNPIPYYAPYCNYSSHYDQNEKLQMFGVQYVCAVDGHSFFVTSAAVMPVKNNVVIYNDVFRQSVLNFGLSDQIVVDHGNEFVLTLAMQERLAAYRYCQRRPPYRQVPSKLNNRIERWWSEVNTRVSFPIKAALRDLTEDGIIASNSPTDMYCVSKVSIKLAHWGLQECVASWNSHKIVGKGKPIDVMQRNNFGQHIDPQLLVPGDEAAEMYRNAGGRITDDCDFGRDPLSGEADLFNRRSIEWERRNEGVESTFGKLVNFDPAPFKSMICSYIELTQQLEELII